MKPIRFVPALVLSLLLWGSCGLRYPTIGLFVYNQQDPFLQTFTKHILDRAYGVFSITVFYADNSQLIQNEQIERMIDQKPVLMMVNPVDRLGSFAIIQRLKRERIPVIFFNREPLAEDLALWNKTWYVGARAEQSGELEAEMVMELFGNDPYHLNQYDRNGDGVIQIFILKGEQGHQDAETRTAAVLQSFKKRHFKVEVVGLEVANWNFDEAYVKIDHFLAAKHNPFELVISNNDNMALGAISKLRQAGFFKDTNGDGKIDRRDLSWVPVVGIDGLHEAEDSIASGYLYGTVRNDSAEMANSLVQLAKVALGRLPESSLSIPLLDGKYIWVDYKPDVSQK